MPVSDPNAVTKPTLDTMSWEELLELRRRAGNDPIAQEALAPFEHRAYAREYVRERPWSAPGVAAAVPAYALSKALRRDRGGARTPPSADQVYAGLHGVIEGILQSGKK